MPSWLERVIWICWGLVQAQNHTAPRKCSWYWYHFYTLHFSLSIRCHHTNDSCAFVPCALCALNALYGPEYPGCLHQHYAWAMFYSCSIGVTSHPWVSLKTAQTDICIWIVEICCISFAAIVGWLWFGYKFGVVFVFIMITSLDDW